MHLSDPGSEMARLNNVQIFYFCQFQELGMITHTH